MNALPTEGSVLQLIPARGEVWFTAEDGSQWDEHLIGYGIEVHYVDQESRVYETAIEPVVLDERRFPMTLTRYMRDRSGDIRYTIKLQRTPLPW